MSEVKVPRTILEAIISAIENNPNKQATLDELYVTVPKLLGKNVNGAIIRGTINRSLETRNKSGPYPICFKRVTSGTYALAKL